MSATPRDPSEQEASLPSSNSNPTSAAPSQRGWRLLLLGSLAINLLFAGMAAGSLWSWKRQHSGGSVKSQGATDLAMTGFIRTLPKERAKELRRVIKNQQRPDLLPLLADIRQARRDAAGILSAETFDREKLAAAFSSIDSAEAAAKAAARGSLFSVAEHLTAPERQALTERWKARRPHHFNDKPAATDRLKTNAGGAPR